jgi:hypothetical protein
MTGGSASVGSSERTCSSRAVTSASAAVLSWLSLRRTLTVLWPARLVDST